MGLTCDSGEPGGLKWPLLTRKDVSVCPQLFPALTQCLPLSLPSVQTQTTCQRLTPCAHIQRQFIHALKCLRRCWMAVQVAADSTSRPGWSNAEAVWRTCQQTLCLVKQMRVSSLTNRGEFHLFVFQPPDTDHISDTVRQKLLVAGWGQTVFVSVVVALL